MKIYTFDVFDTLLVRSCNHPNNIFALLAYGVLNEPSDVNVNEFIKIRILAEQQALVKTKKEEVTIREIYKECNWGLLCRFDNDKIMEMEMDLEWNHLYPVAKMMDLIERVRNESPIPKIGFISDMYLPKSFIKGILSKYNYYRKNDFLLISSEENAKKSTGHLYTKIENIIGCNLKQTEWHHWGDNNHSDCMNVIKMGGICHYVNYAYTMFEKSAAKFITSTSEILINNYIGCQKASRLLLGDDRLCRFESNLIAPLFVSFCAEVLFHAIKRKTKKLYFFSRDSFVLYKISKYLIKQLNMDIELKYLYISRTPIYLSSLEECSCFELLDIMPLDNHSRSVISILETFGLSDILELDSVYYEKNISEEKKRILLDDLFEKNSFFRKEVHRRAVEMRQALLGYLYQEGFATHQEYVSFVDLSGTRKSQALLNRLLSRNGFNTIFGYYLSNTKKSASINETGPYYCAVPVCGSYDGFQKQMEVIESFYAANSQNKTIGYAYDDNKWGPVFENLKWDTNESNVEHSNLEACLTFAEMYVKDLPVITNNRQVLSLSIWQNENFFKMPSPQYLKVFDNFWIIDSKNKAKPIIGRMSLKETFLFFRYNKSPRSTMWPKGSIIRYYGLLGHWMLLLYLIDYKSFLYRLPYGIKKIWVIATNIIHKIK